MPYWKRKNWNTVSKIRIGCARTWYNTSQQVIWTWMAIAHRMIVQLGCHLLLGCHFIEVHHFRSDDSCKQLYNRHGDVAGVFVLRLGADKAVSKKNGWFGRWEEAGIRGQDIRRRIGHLHCEMDCHCWKRKQSRSGKNYEVFRQTKMWYKNSIPSPALTGKRTPGS